MKNTSPNGIRRILFLRNSSRKYSTKHVKKKNKKTSASRRADIPKMLFRFTTISTCGNTAKPVRKKQNSKEPSRRLSQPGGGFCCAHLTNCEYSGIPGELFAFRYSLGVIRYRSLNTRLNVRWLSKPLSIQISVIVRFVFSRQAQA